MAPNRRTWAAMNKHLFIQTAKSPRLFVTVIWRWIKILKSPVPWKILEVKLDKLVAQNLDKKVENLEKNSKKKLEKLIGLINRIAPPDVVTTTSSNETEICDNALKKMETKLEQLIVNKLETKLEKLLQQNLETKRLERLTTLINKTADPDIVRQLLDGTFDAALKKIETKLEKIRALTHKGNLSGRVT